MKNIKKIFSYVVVAALVMALSISCKNEETTGSGDIIGSTTQSHPTEGSYSNNSSVNGSATVSINGDICTITGTAFNNNNPTNFNITVTKWFYYYGDDKVYYAGSDYEQSEATINSPATDYFYVSYNTDSGELWIVFGPEGKRYYTGNLKKG